MPLENTKRKLATILFADIAGYTALMQDNETQALEYLQIFKDVVEKHVPENNGEIIQYFGDGCLLTFDSTTECVECSLKIQELFIEKKVPVRVGIHQGEVVFKDDNVFGDGVNIASRIESIGIPGSILMSKTVRNQIKNKSEYALHSLGHVHFKNVVEEVEVYALTADFLAIPDSNTLQGKLEVKDKKKILSPTLLFGVLTIAVLGLWMASSIFADSVTVTTEINENIRSKRLTVLQFDNLTNDEDLDMFGVMIADWLTKGFIESGDVDLISAQNIDYKNEESRTIAKSGFVENAGVDIILDGRYYLNEDQIIIHSDLRDVRTGQVIQSLGNIQGSRSDLIALLDDLSEQTLGYWSTKESKRYRQNPPKYTAYNYYMEAIFNWRRDPEKTEFYLKQAIREDSTFYIPVFKYMVFLANRNRFMELDSIAKSMGSKLTEFTAWERLRFDAIIEEDREKAAQLNLQLFEIDQTARTPFNNTLQFYIQIGKPKSAIALAEQYAGHPIIENDRKFGGAVTEALLAAFFLDDQYIKVIETYENASDWFEFDFAFEYLYYLKSLIHVGRIQEVFQILKDITSSSNSSMHPDLLYKGICDEFQLIGDTRNFNQAIEAFEKYNNDNIENQNFINNKGFLAWYKGEYQTAYEMWSKEFSDNQIEFGDLDVLFQQLMLGLSQIKMGNDDFAMNLIAHLKGLNGYPSVRYAATQYAIGVLYTNLGEYDLALENFEKSLRNGALRVALPFERYIYFNFKNDVFIKEILKDPRFVELVKME